MLAPGDARANSVAAEGPDVYVVGQVSSALPGHSDACRNDAFIRKYDPDGNELWARRFGTEGGDEAHSVAVHGSLGYVVGLVELALPGQTDQAPLPAPNSPTDAFVRCYDADGTEIWTDQIGSTAWTRGYGVAVNDDGVYVVGSAQHPLPGQEGLGSVDAFARKYDHEGVAQWTRTLGSSDVDIAYNATTIGTEVVIVGQVDSEMEGAVEPR